MSFVYHIKQSNMQGNQLLPLNQLKDLWPEIYEKASRKYKGREILMSKKVPLLGCLWNDVLHFSVIHPSIIAQTLQECGATNLPNVLWFKIPVAALPDLPTIELDSLPHLLRPEGKYTFYEEDAKIFDEGAYRELDQVPDWTRQYYAKELSEGRHPLLFNGAPHILIQGPVSVEKVEIIDWLKPTSQVEV